jgi:hypothetical protein
MFVLLKRRVASELHLTNQTTALFKWSLITWSRFLRDKLLVDQLVQKFPAFLESGGSLPYSRESAFSKVQALFHKFLLQGTVSSPSSPKAEGSPLVGCSRLLIQYSYSDRT